MSELMRRLATDLLPFVLYLVGSVFFVAGTVLAIVRALR